jgi:hypothetical protein
MVDTDQKAEYWSDRNLMTALAVITSGGQGQSTEPLNL